MDLRVARMDLVLVDDKAKQELFANLSKNTKSRIIKASEVTNTKYPLASVNLTKDLGGGIGAGRQTLIYGNKSSGKSSSCLEMIALNQKNGKVCAWIDAENSFDVEWATKLGVNVEELLLSEAKSIHDALTVTQVLLKANVDIIVVDSISALVPSSYFEDKGELAEGLDKTKQIGSFSKEMAIFCNKANLMNSNTALVFISQVRNKFNTWGASLKPMGGESMMFFSSTVIKLWSSATEKEQITAEVTIGDKIISRPVGRRVNYTIEYNKIGPPNQYGEYDFYYGGDRVGIDQVGEIVDSAEALGIISKGGAWYSFEHNGESISLQGRKKVVAMVKENSHLRDELLEKINGKS